MKVILKEDIERIEEFADFCKQKDLQIVFRPDGTFDIRYSNY